MKNLKHKKYKNTGLIYEMLIQKMTSEVISGGEVNSVDLLRQHFTEGKELRKELSIYRALYKQRFSDRLDAQMLVESLREAYNKLDEEKLKSEKYNLVKTIKKSIGFDNLFSIEIPDYKIHASIYNLLEYDDQDDPVYMTRCKSNLLEHITREDKENLAESIYKEDPNLLNVTYKIFVEKFNDKYKGLTPSQKNLLKEYIETPDNSVEFKEVFFEECKYVYNKLSKFVGYNSDKALNIKLETIVEWLDTVQGKIFLKEDDISTLMKYQDLMNELNIRDERFIK